ncbi:oxidoreductase, partial [Escherichia coli]|nr:oxidoreductase [Escherichia coli]
GRPWPLIDGVGQIYGMYVITGLNTTRSELDRYGRARKIEFTVTFERVDEDLRERLQSSSLGDLANNVKGALNNLSIPV